MEVWFRWVMAFQVPAVKSSRVWILVRKSKILHLKGRSNHLFLLVYWTDASKISARKPPGMVLVGKFIGFQPSRNPINHGIIIILGGFLAGFCPTVGQKECSSMTFPRSTSRCLNSHLSSTMWKSWCGSFFSFPGERWSDMGNGFNNSFQPNFWGNGIIIRTRAET